MAEVAKLPIPALPGTAYTSKHAKRRKTAEEKKEEKKAARKRRQESCKTRIYIGGAFDRWKSLKVLKGLRSDMQLAVLLLDCYEKWCALVSNIPQGSISDCCKVEKHPDDSIYIGKCKRELPCDQEIQANPLMDGDLHLKGGSEITSNMSHEEGCTGITFDISEITFAPDQDSNCSNEEAGDEEEEEEDEEEEDDEAEESEEEFDDSDPEWENDDELSDFDPLEKKDSKDQLWNNDSDDEFEKKYLHGKVRELCPDCGAFFYGGKTHTCEYKTKPFPCNVCGKRYKDQWGLKSHGRIHKDDYQYFCKFCLVPFKTRLDKLAHQTAHSPNERPYSCPDCAMTFSKLRVRNFHLKEHRGPNNVSCPHCDLVFSNAYLVKRHIVVHTGVKQFVCQFCSRSFNQPGHLKSHLRLHTGEKPYQCQHCDKSFNHNVSLKSHVMRYHKGVSDLGPREHTKEVVEAPAAKTEEVNEEMSTADPEDKAKVVINPDPKLKEPMKPIKKIYHRSMGRPIGRPKRNAATGKTNSIPAAEALQPITAAEPSEEDHLKGASSKSIASDWSDRDPTSELEEEDEAEESKGVRKSKRKASQRPKTAEGDFDSDSDFDPAEDEAKRRRTSWQKSGSVGGRRGRPRKNRLV